MPDDGKSAVLVAARQVLANERDLSLDQLAKKIVDMETSPNSDVRAERILVVANILRRYIDTGYFVQKGDVVCAFNGPVDLLLDRGFKESHIDRGNDNVALRHFCHPSLPNVYFQIFDYGDGTWSQHIVTHRTQDENAEVEKIVSDLGKLPGKITSKVWS